MLGKNILIRSALLIACLAILSGLSGCQTGSVGTTTAPSGSASAQTPDRPLVRLSTTTSVYDSGLLAELEQAFEKSTGYELDIIANGTGAAIKLGETGDADVLLVHAKASEEAFVEAGYGVKRLPFMHNFFVIAGPAANPAGVSDADNATAAFQKIAAAAADFISRGDDSGTHKAELKIWEKAAVSPAGDWYQSAGKGMEACLIMAGEMQAYVLTDKATYLVTADKTGLKILLGESDDLKNTYALIAVNPDKNPGINAEGAQAWIDFMLGDQAKAIISAFGLDQYGEALFFYDGLPSE